MRKQIVDGVPNNTGNDRLYSLYQFKTGNFAWNGMTTASSAYLLKGEEKCLRQQTGSPI